MTSRTEDKGNAMTTTKPAACLHRQVRDRNGRGPQDLFCVKPAGHDGNHRHDSHPDGVTYRDGRWVYGKAAS